MPLLPVRLPPGIVRNGTEYGSKGRFFDAWQTRWTDDGTIKPTGGWRLRSSDVENAVEGAPRACLTWKDNAAQTWLGIGTHSGLYVQDRAGDVFDITPTSFTPGRADAVSAAGYGMGPYGAGTYGTPRPDSSAVQPASQWTLDSWGENLVGVMAEDGVIVEWELDTNTEAGPVASAPACSALVVTAEGFLFALGTTDPRTVSWCDQRDNTEWTPDVTNQAGDFALQTAGALMCGKVVKGGILLFTDLDVHLASYIGGTSVYGFDRIGSACGVISRQCVAAIDAQAVWMGSESFWLYNGYIQPLPCDVQDYVFSDFNRLQQSKTYAVRDSANSEVQFYYCSAASNEIDRCVVWNYKKNHWTIGRKPRTCGTDRGVFTYPIFVDIAGTIFEHEVGGSYDGTMPYAETGPVELGNGDNRASFYGAIPDEGNSGDVTLTFYTRDRPNSPEVVRGPFALKPKTDFRFNAGSTRVRYSGARLSDWRAGTFRLNVKVGSKR